MFRKIGLARRFGRGSDLVVAVTIGVIAELLLATHVFQVASALAPAPAWLEASQMPGAFIANRLEERFRWFSSWTMAFACISIFQALLFILVALGIIYAYRILRGQQGSEESPQKVSVLEQS